jgi:hypothetical protein
MRRSSVFMNFPRGRRWQAAVLLGAGFWFAAGTWARAETDASFPSDKPAAAPAKADILVYNDGDRVRGHLIDRSVDSWVFMSERFGLLRVPLADAKVILGTPEAAAAIARADKEEARRKAEEAENVAVLSWSRLSPFVLADRLRDFFGPWHGRFAFSIQDMNNGTETTNETVAATLKRKWTADNIELNAHYDFADTNHVTTTDVLKADATWRHDFPDKLFALYTPSVEWNRANFVTTTAPDGIAVTSPANYVLLQQEIGVGVTLFSKPTRHLRLGVAENIFNVWQTSEPESSSKDTSQSVFAELDWKLPWRMTLTERGVYYYSIASQRDGWENKLELDKKLTETFTIGIRHEVRHNSPDVHVQNYTLLKLLMGIDF